jgi:hypothetical protein
MRDAVEITVIICTRDRPALLRRALESLHLSDKPPFAWEVVVVDNGSASEASQVAAGLEGTLPIRVIRERRIGLSHARNAGVQATNARHLIWTDDDVVVGSRWLCAYADAFARWPKADFFGGGISPLFEPEAPRWLQRGFDGVATGFAHREPPSDWRRIERGADQLPFGANMAFRAAALGKDPFDTRLGLGSGAIELGEETSVFSRLLGRGGYGVWVPNADVHHVIGPERQTTAYLWRYYQRVGAYIAHLDAKAANRRDVGELRLRAAASIARYLGKRVLARPEVWTHYLRTAAIDLGAYNAARASAPN